MKIHTIQLHIGDLIGGTSAMDATEFGAYMNLILCCYQDQNHEIPSEDARLARMAKCSLKTWNRIKEKVIHKFIPTPTGFTHERILKESVKYMKKSSINKANALKRWETDMRMASESQCERNATQDPRPKNLSPTIPSTAAQGAGDLKPSVSGGLAGFSVERLLTDKGREKAKMLCKSLNRDIYSLIPVYDKGVRDGTRDAPRFPDAAFYAWIERYTKGEAL